eukprot:scaffold234387_cov22-Tisochrysis_lutea.AAC.1
MRNTKSAQHPEHTSDTYGFAAPHWSYRALHADHLQSTQTPGSRTGEIAKQIAFQRQRQARLYKQDYSMETLAHAEEHP